MRATNEGVERRISEMLNTDANHTLLLHTHTHTLTPVWPKTTRNGLQCNKDWQQQTAMAKIRARTRCSSSLCELMKCDFLSARGRAVGGRR